MDRHARRVPRRNPALDFCGQLVKRGDASVQTLPGKGRKFDFGHVEPTRVFGRVVERDVACKLTGGCGVKRFIQRTVGMGIEIIIHDRHVRYFGTQACHGDLHKARIVMLRPLRPDVDVALPGINPVGEQRNGTPIPFVRIVLFGKVARLNR